MRVKNYNPTYSNIEFSLSDILGTKIFIDRKRIDLLDLKRRYGTHNLITIYDDEVKQLSGCIIEVNESKTEYETDDLNSWREYE